MAIFCSLCGANLALTGRAHRCIPRVDEQPVDTVDAIADVDNDVANAENATDDAPTAAPASPSATYRYRDAGKRRTYMRDLMRRKRAAARAS